MLMTCWIVIPTVTRIYDSGSSSTGNLVDKHLTLERPSGNDLKSTDTSPIKATMLALDVTKANEITIENSKTGKLDKFPGKYHVPSVKSRSKINYLELGRVLSL